MIVDDSAMMRGIIAGIVSSDPDLEVCGKYPNGEEALLALDKVTPDIIMLDIEMPVMNGIEFLRRIKTVSSAKVIVLSVLTQASSKVSIDALDLGAVALVAKPSGAVSLDLEAKKGHELVKTIREAAGLD